MMDGTALPQPPGHDPDEQALQRAMNRLADSIEKATAGGSRNLSDVIGGQVNEIVRQAAAGPNAAQLLGGRKSLTLFTPDLQKFPIRNDEDLQKFREAGGSVPNPARPGGTPPMNPPTVTAYQGQPPPASSASQAVQQLLQQVLRQAAAGQARPPTSGAPQPTQPPAGWFGKLRKNRVGRFLGGLGRSAYRGAKGSAGRTQLGRSFGGLVGAGRNLAGAKTAGAAGAGVAKFGGAAGLFTSALVDAGKAVERFAYLTNDSNRRLAEFSPTQAVQQAQLDANRMVRDLERGEATSGSAGELVKSLDRFERVLQPIQIILDNLTNKVAAGLLDVLTEVMEILGKILQALAELLKRLFNIDLTGEEDKGELIPFGDWLSQKYQEVEGRDRAARDKIEAMRLALAGGF